MKAVKVILALIMLIAMSPVVLGTFLARLVWQYVKCGVDLFEIFADWMEED